MRFSLWLAALLLPMAASQLRSEMDRDRELEWRCPQHWIQFRSLCYRFIKSPNRPRAEARKNCQAYDADLVSVDTLDEHTFIMQQLNWQDPQHRRWYTSGRQQSANYWVNEGDNSQLSNMDAAFFPDYDNSPGRDYLAYGFSDKQNRWGFERVRGDEYLLYVCEVAVSKLHHLVVDDRTHEYGLEVRDPEKVPRGPYFVKQPANAVFDESSRVTQQYVTMTCVAKGYPNPTYEWFREDYESDQLVARKIDPLKDSRYTISGGSLIIYNPKQTVDNGLYHCRASNKFGSIVSESVQLSFAFIGEFNLKRSPEKGQQNWGKAIYCDPPQHYPSVTYNWARDYFPNLVEEDKRTFVSYDGNLYFSSLENIDRGNYLCNVQSSVSSTGRTGPTFPLDVVPHSNSQQLKYGNNFPKAFPEAPVAGQEVRLECVAFGYPVPSYNWTRKGSNLPRNAIVSNYNRVLTIPKVQVEDQGEYVCRVFNDRLSIQNSVVLTIRAEPNFTIPLTDKHLDKGSDLIWTCEAFGIPDVTYSWLRNGELLDPYNITYEDRERVIIQDNVLTIKSLDAERDPGVYQCQARNQLKTRYSSGQLRVLSLKPSFAKRPLEQETYAHEGGNVTIKCNPEAAPRPKFTWKKETSVIGSGGTRRILDNGNLIITRVSRDDSGIYTCTARNVHGSDESRGKLVVLRGPSFIRPLDQKRESTYGHNIYIECAANSEEILDLAYTWKLNGLSMKDKYRENSTVKIEGGRLQIENATFADAGLYECIVESAVGMISAKTHIKIIGPPGPPGAVDAKPVARASPRSVLISWADGPRHGKDISYYQIAGRTKWNDTWITLAKNVTANRYFLHKDRREYEVKDILAPWSVYEFQVAAGNELGLGIPSAASPYFNTQPDKPYIAPRNIGGGGGKIGDLTITWKPLKKQDQNGPDIFYKVYWKRKGANSEFQSLELRKHGNIGMQVVKIQSEFFYTKFEVRVQAGNAVGYGPISDPVTIYSAEDMPQVAPVQVAARSFNSTSLNVTWLPIDQGRDRIRGRLIGHRLKYWKKDAREEDSVYYLSRSTKNWALIVGLQPNEYYYVKVMAYNSAGEGPESERFLERTFRKAPQKAPTSVHIYSVDPSTVRVVWRYVAPAPDEEPIIGYKLRVWELDHDMSSANDSIISVGSKLEGFINELSPGKAFNLRVLAYSNGGDGRMSSPTLTFQMGDKELLRSGSTVTSAATSTLLLLILVSLAQRVLLHQ